jgi:serine/threonine protein kinase, bacterial
MTPPPVIPPSTTATGRLPASSLLGNGCYLVLKLLGQGGMGAVYLAEHTRLKGALLAVKEMSNAQLSPAERPQALAAFQQEAQLLATLHHPNIPRVSDTFSENGKEYLVMEYVNGETLGQKLEQNGGQPLPEKEVIPWALQLCDVLHYLHGRQPPIIFRDLKPANIMIDKQGQVKLIDFGIVRFFKQGQAQDTTKLGSPGYSPPEQYGQGQTEARSDIYALAATLHHLLTGQDPSLNPFKFQPPHQLNRQLSRTVGEALMKALSKKPADRWPDMLAFKQALAGSGTAVNQAPSFPQPVQSRRAPAASPAFMAGQTAIATPLPLPPPPPLVPNPNQALPPSPVMTFYPDTDVLMPRAIAHVIDGFILSLFTVVYLIAFGFLQAVFYDLSYQIGSDAEIFFLVATSLLTLLALFVNFGYYTFFHSRSGQTPGKRLMGIEVVALDGSRISWPRALWRTVTCIVTIYIGSMFCLLIFPYIVPFVNENRRTAHDFLAGTMVVRK